MKKYLKYLVMLAPMLTTACHYKITAPILWAHGSTGAFNAWMTFWIINAGLFFNAYLYVRSR